MLAVRWHRSDGQRRMSNGQEGLVKASLMSRKGATACATPADETTRRFQRGRPATKGFRKRSQRSENCATLGCAAPAGAHCQHKRVVGGGGQKMMKR
eukprot:1024696-Rhodomonas_salina.1